MVENIALIIAKTQYKLPQKQSVIYRKNKVQNTTNSKCKTPQKRRIYCVVKKELLLLHKLK